MLVFLSRRVALLVAALFASSFIIFSALQLGPGSPLSALTGGRSLPPSVLQHLSDQYHLNEGFFAQYWYWLVGVLHGNFGESTVLHQSVSAIISERILVTIELVAYAGILVTVVGVGLGTLAGIRRGAVDAAVLLITTVAAAIPAFLAAVVLLGVFSVQLGWLPVLGAGSGVLDRIEHLTLPAVALATSGVAIVARVTRVSVQEEFKKEHVETASSRGLPATLVIRRHVIRNAAIPIVTITGITVTSLIALAAVVETAFALQGLGATLIQAASQKDIALVQGIALVLVTAFLVSNTLIDLLYGVLDPRLTIGRRTE